MDLRKPFLALSFTLFSFLAFSQVQSEDSLYSALLNLPEGKEKVDSINSILKSMRDGGKVISVRIGHIAVETALKMGYREGLAFTYEHMGWIYYRRGLYSESFENSEKAIRLFESLEDKSGQARCLNNLAAINYEMGKYYEAIKGFRNGYQLGLEANDNLTVVRSLNNIGFCFLSLNKLDSAELYARKGYEYSTNHQPLPSAFSLRLLGDILVKEQKLKEAVATFERVIIQCDSTNNIFVRTSTGHRLGDALLKMGKMEEASSTLLENIEICEKNGYLDELTKSHQTLSRVYESAGQLSQALYHARIFQTLSDSLNNQKLNDKISILQENYEDELREREISDLKAETVTKTDEINRQKNLRNYFMAALLLFIILVALLTVSLMRLKKHKEALSHKNEEISQQAQQLRGVSIAKDKLLSVLSHDMRSPLNNLRGMLTFLNQNVMDESEFRNFSQKIEKRLQILVSELDTILHWTQSQLQQQKTKPVNLSLGDLVIQTLILYQDSLIEKNLSIADHIEKNLMVRFDTEHLKIIIRNILSNAIKFTEKGGTITLSAHKDVNIIQFSIEDTGKGMHESDIEKLFNPSIMFTTSGTENEKGTGVGLLLVKELLDLNNAKIRVESEMGKGSKFILSLPAS